MRIGFLAESFCPKIRLYRGATWAHLWDLFLEYRSDDTPWWQRVRAKPLLRRGLSNAMIRANILADDLLRELSATPTGAALRL